MSNAPSLRSGDGGKRRSRAALVAFVIGFSASATSRATCLHPSSITPCINANALWVPTGDARFFSIPRPVATAAGRMAIALGLQALFQPLRVEVPSPNDTGRDVALVDFALDQDLSLALGAGKEIDIGLSFPMILHQRGTGLPGITSQKGAPLEPTAERDPRLSIARAVVLSGSLRMKPRAAIAIALGPTTAFASSGSSTLAPGLALEWTSRVLTLAVDMALRLRPTVDLGSARSGSQALLALGVSVDALQPHLLALNLEAWIAPSLVDTTADRGRALGLETSLLPAEWLLSVRSQPEPGAPWSIALGAGAGLALSRETWHGSAVDFLAPASPTWRALAEIRYAPATLER